MDSVQSTTSKDVTNGTTYREGDDKFLAGKDEVEKIAKADTVTEKLPE